jgi:hypothetical protein
MLWTKYAWAKYLKKDDPLRVELEDLCRRYQLFGKAAIRLLKK